MYEMNIPFFSFLFFSNKTTIDPLLNCFFHLTKREHFHALFPLLIPYAMSPLLDIYLSCLQPVDSFLILSFALQSKVTEVLALLHF